MNNNDLIINELVLNKASKNNQIIYGARAYNNQAPTYLKKKTIDYDVLTNKPKKYANEIAKELSRRLDKNVEVVKGKHKGTYRVKIDNETIVDYTQLKNKPETIRSWGNNYRSLKSIKSNAKKTSEDPKNEYRKEKDLDTIKRINEIQRMDNLFKKNKDFLLK